MQMRSLFILSSFYEEVPEKNLDEMHVDRYFHRNSFKDSQSLYRKTQSTTSSAKKSVTTKLFQFFVFKTQQRRILQEEKIISREERGILVDSLGEFLKAFDQANKRTINHTLNIPLGTFQ